MHSSAELICTSLIGRICIFILIVPISEAAFLSIGISVSCRFSKVRNSVVLGLN